jgi:hypothetical protein
MIQLCVAKVKDIQLNTIFAHTKVAFNLKQNHTYLLYGRRKIVFNSTVLNLSNYAY